MTRVSSQILKEIPENLKKREQIIIEKEKELLEKYNNDPSIPFWSNGDKSSDNKFIGCLHKSYATHKNKNNLDWCAACFFEFIWSEMFCEE